MTASDTVKVASLASVLSGAGRLGGALTGISRSNSLLKNISSGAKSTLFPSWGKAITAGGEMAGLSPRLADRLGKVTGTALALPTLGYGAYGLARGAQSAFNTDDAARAAASSVLNPTEDVRGAASTLGYQVPDFDSKVQSVEAQLDPAVTDTLTGVKDHGILGGLFRQYVYGRDGLGGNRLGMKADASDRVNKAMGSMTKSVGTNIGAAFHNVPNWHKSLTWLTSPLQRPLRDALPATPDKTPVTNAIASIGDMPNWAKDLSGAYEQTAHAGRKRLTTAAEQGKDLWNKYVGAGQ